MGTRVLALLPRRTSPYTGGAISRRFKNMMAGKVVLVLLAIVASELASGAHFSSRIGPFGRWPRMGALNEPTGRIGPFGRWPRMGALNEPTGGIGPFGRWPRMGALKEPTGRIGPFGRWPRMGALNEPTGRVGAFLG